MATGDRDAERVTVQTYVPAYQREMWGREADELGMSRAEFVRSMIQAGRRSFELDDPVDSTEETRPADTPSDPFDPGDDAVETRIHEVLEGLDDGTRMRWDQLLEQLSAPLQDRMASVLSRLEDDGIVDHEARHGGYVLIEDGE